MKLKGFQKSAVIMIFGSALLFAGCSDSGIQAENSVISDESAVSAVSYQLSGENSEVSVPAETSELNSQSSDENTYSDRTAPTTFSLWNNNFGFPERVIYQYETEGPTNVYETYDKDLIQKLIDAVKQIDLKKAVDVRIADDYTAVDFYFGDNVDIQIEFEGQYLLRDNKCYEVSGFDDLKAVLKEFEEKGTKLTPKQDNNSYVPDNSSESSTEMYYLPPTEDNVVTDAESGITYVKNQLLVSVSENYDKDEFKKTVEKMGAEIVGYIDLIENYQIEFKEDKTLNELENTAEELEKYPYIESVTLNLAGLFADDESEIYDDVAELVE